MAYISTSYSEIYSFDQLFPKSKEYTINLVALNLGAITIILPLFRISKIYWPRSTIFQFNPPSLEIKIPR